MEEDTHADELATLGRALYGERIGWLTRMAADTGVHYDSLRHMLSGRRPVPETLLSDLRARLSAQPAVEVALSIARPPPGSTPEGDRDGPAGDAMDVALDTLAAAAEAAGWHPAEVAAATLGWATHRIADGAGETEALHALEDAAELVRMRDR